MSPIDETTTFSLFPTKLHPRSLQKKRGMKEKQWLSSIFQAFWNSDINSGVKFPSPH